MKIIVPEAPAPQANAPQARRGRGTQGLRLGLLDNSKSNADHLFNFLVDRLRATVPITSIVSLRKPYPSLPADESVIEQLAKEADLVVSAMAD
jgi:hypothetical protein